MKAQGGHGANVGDFVPCGYKPCADDGGGFTVTQRTAWNKKYCKTDCRVKDLGWPDEDTVKQAMKQKRRAT